MKYQKGSITVFSLLCILLVTAMLCVLLEGCRRWELGRYADLRAEVAIESVFANYNSCLWENYRLLATDIEQSGKILDQALETSVERGANFLQLKSSEVLMGEYMRITDGDGMVFLKSVSAYMKENLVYEAIKEIYSQYEAFKHLLENSDLRLGHVDEALEELESLNIERQSIGTTGGNNIKLSDIKQLLEEIKHWTEMGVLELVIEDKQNISDATADFKNGVLERKLKSGTVQLPSKTTWMDRVFLQQYLLTYLSNFRNTQANRALSYEVEYLLGKQSSDIGNLNLVVGQMLLLREASNFMYLLSDSQKYTQVQTLATVSLGASLNPALIELVKLGILTAWAFAESVLDVRALLAGKKIPLLKSDETWTSDIAHLSEWMDGFSMSKDCDWGVSYEGYLGILLLFQNEQTLAMSTLNIQEASIRKVYGEPEFQIDTLITQAQVDVVYQYETIFPFLNLFGELGWPNSMQGYARYNYY